MRVVGGFLQNSSSAQELHPRLGWAGAEMQLKTEGQQSLNSPRDTPPGQFRAIGDAGKQMGPGPMQAYQPITNNSLSLMKLMLTKLFIWL